jgi:hypothetical protein
MSLVFSLDCSFTFRSIWFTPKKQTTDLLFATYAQCQFLVSTLFALGNAVYMNSVKLPRPPSYMISHVTARTAQKKRKDLPFPPPPHSQGCPSEKTMTKVPVRLSRLNVRTPRRILCLDGNYCPVLSPSGLSGCLRQRQPRIFFSPLSYINMIRNHTYVLHANKTR